MKTYVQIGAHLGNDLFQNEIDLLKDQCRVILIEPNTSCLQRLAKVYQRNAHIHNIDIINVGIVPARLKLDNLYLYPSTTTDAGEPSALSTTIHRKSYPNYCKIEKFIPKSFTDLCFEFDITDIELLAVDAEGLDYEILLDINLNLINIRRILFEQWEYKDDDLNYNVRTGPDLLPLIQEKFKDYVLFKSKHDYCLVKYDFSSNQEKSKEIVREWRRNWCKLKRKCKDIKRNIYARCTTERKTVRLYEKMYAYCNERKWWKSKSSGGQMSRNV